jgi:hypothetical protein
MADYELATKDYDKQIVEIVREREERNLPRRRESNTVAPAEYLKSGAAAPTQDVELEEERGIAPSVKKHKSTTKHKPLGHWADHIAKEFERLPEKTQKAWLDSFKIVEKGFIKQVNELKEDLIVAEDILALVEPFYDEMLAKGISPKAYIKSLIDFDRKVGQDAAYEIARMIIQHGVTLEKIYPKIVQAEKDMLDDYNIRRHIDPLKKEIAKLKGEDVDTATVIAEANREADELFEKIRNYYEQVDEQGEKLYPNAFDHMEDIIELIQGGENLDDAYDLVMFGRRLNDEEVEGEIEDTPTKKHYDPRDSEAAFLAEKARQLGM